jgi:hypothetical protein
MNFEELQIKRHALAREYEGKIEHLNGEYAKEHNPVKIGDIVTDHYHTIRVESMEACVDYNRRPYVPIIKYIGPEMTKDGKPKKRQPRYFNPVFQQNIKAINGDIYQYKIE